MTLIACTGGNKNNEPKENNTKVSGNETPVPSNKVVVNCINMHHGSFLYHDQLGTDHVQYFNIGDPSKLGSDGILMDVNGNSLARFDVENGIITGFTIIDSTWRGARQQANCLGLSDKKRS